MRHGIGGAVIEGLKVQVKGSELIEKLRARVAFHGKKAEVAERKRAALEDVSTDLKKQFSAEEMDEDEINELVSSSQYNTSRITARQYLDKEREHRTRSAYLAFVADHLDPLEVYVLTEHELYSIEIVTR